VAESHYFQKSSVRDLADLDILNYSINSRFSNTMDSRMSSIVMTQSGEIQGHDKITKTTLKAHAPKIFKKIRSLDGIDDKKLIKSLDPDDNLI
jgi:hypothetical protein